MGAWGSDSFENDEAADWVDDFCDKPDPAVIVNTLSAVADIDAGEYLEASDCSAGIAAAEVVAALKGMPNSNLLESTKSCLSNLKFKAEPGLIALALKAIARIKTDSELKEVWDESENSEEWYQAISNLEERLNR